MTHTLTLFSVRSSIPVVFNRTVLSHPRSAIYNTVDGIPESLKIRLSVPHSLGPGKRVRLKQTSLITGSRLRSSVDTEGVWVPDN